MSDNLPGSSPSTAATSAGLPKQTNDRDSQRRSATAALLASAEASSTGEATPVSHAGATPGGILDDASNGGNTTKSDNPLKKARDLNEVKRHQEASVKEKQRADAAEKRAADFENKFKEYDELFSSKDPVKLLQRLGIHPDELVRKVVNGEVVVPDETDAKLDPIQKKLKELEDYKNSVETEKQERLAAEQKAASDREAQEFFDMQSKELQGHIEDLVDEFPFAAAFGFTAPTIVQEAKKLADQGEDVDMGKMVENYNRVHQESLRDVFTGKHASHVIKALLSDEAVFSAVRDAVDERRGVSKEHDVVDSSKDESGAKSRQPTQGIPAIPGHLSNEVPSRQTARMTDAQRRDRIRQIGNGRV